MDLTLIRDGMNQAVPFARHVGIVLEDVEPGRATARLPEDEHLRNHVGSQHAGALFTVVDTASGAAMVGALAECLGGLRPLVRDAWIRYRKVARGEILATATFDVPVEDVLAALDAEGRTDIGVSVELTDAGGDVVADARIRWNVKVTG